LRGHHPVLRPQPQQPLSAAWLLRETIAPPGHASVGITRHDIEEHMKTTLTLMLCAVGLIVTVAGCTTTVEPTAPAATTTTRTTTVHSSGATY
jgi:hypothetical protein